MTDRFFIDLAITLFGYLILGLSYLGAGWIFSRILKISFSVERNFFSLIWLGWAGILFLLQVLNLFFPINIYSSLPILLLGLFFAIRLFKTQLRTPIPLLSRTYFILLVIAVLWIADLSMAATTVYDDGLYHFNTIRWLNESPIVLGLGNLHGRLAFNQASFAYVAYLNFYPVFNHGHNLANSFLLMLLLTECLFYLSRYIDRTQRFDGLSTANLTPVFFIFPLIYLAVYNQLPSPTADNTASIVEITIFILFVRLINDKFAHSHVASQSLFIFILSATAISIKLSSLFYALSVCIVLLIIERNSLGTSVRQISQNIIKLMAVPALIIIVWSLRGLLLSGCPAYPSTIGCLPVPWAVPIESVKSEANWIYSWARLPNHRPDTVLNSWNWLKPWFHNLIDGNPFTVVYPTIVFIMVLVVSLFLYQHERDLRKDNAISFAVLAPVLAGLAFWFLTAPDPRFANSLFWILPVSTAVICLQILANARKLKAGFVTLILFIVSASVILEFIFYPFMRGSAEGFMPFQTASLVEKQTRSGLQVLVPAQGDQCWDSQLPCTPNFNTDLSFMDRQYFPEFRVIATQ